MKKKSVKTYKTAKASISSGEPMMVSTASDTTSTSRRNRAATIERTDKYVNIDAGVLPFKYSVGYSGIQMDARDTIILCQKAYFNIPLVKNIIDLMTEFSVGELYLRDGNKSARDFISAWMNKINMWGFQDRFYREYFRSGNNFIFRYDGDVQDGDIRKIISQFGLTSRAYTQLDTPKMRLPARYVILNPADILFAGNISFYAGIYFKRLSDYELLRLRTPKTDEDKEVRNSLPPDIRKQIDSRNIGVVNLPLDPRQVSAIFYKKQDYEPFAAPMVFPVLEDLNAKLELKKIDMAIARTQQQIILLVTMGTEPDKGGIVEEHMIAMRKLFENESVGRVLVADWTTKAEFIIPKIADILTPQKYEELDKDINLGLNNILLGGEKFANQNNKVELFLARLEHGRQVFLTEFLIPEIRRICKSLGFKSYPIPYYDEIKLKDNNARDRIVLRLSELGLLSPSETFTALDSGRLPDVESNIEEQQQYKKDRDSGLFQPLLNSKQQESGDAGRKSGTKNTSTKKMTPIGGEAKYSGTALAKNMKAAVVLNNKVIDCLKEKHKVKELKEKQLSIAKDITQMIIANEEPDNWHSTINSYVDKPVDKNLDRVRKIQSIAAELECDEYTASLLYISPYIENEQQIQ